MSKSMLGAVVCAYGKKSMLFLPAILWLTYGYVVYSNTVEDYVTRWLVYVLLFIFFFGISWRWTLMAFTRIEAYPEGIIIKRLGRMPQKLSYGSIERLKAVGGNRMMEYRIISGGKTVVRYADCFVNCEVLTSVIDAKMCEKLHGEGSLEVKKKYTELWLRHGVYLSYKGNRVSDHSATQPLTKGTIR